MTVLVINEDEGVRIVRIQTEGAWSGRGERRWPITSHPTVRRDTPAWQPEEPEMADDGPGDAAEHLRLIRVRVRHAGQSWTLDDAVQQHRTCITPAVVGDANIINNPPVLPRKADGEPNHLLSSSATRETMRSDATRRSSQA